MITATALAPFRKTESLMAMAGIVLALAGALVLGAVLATERDHLDIDNPNWAWLVPLLTVLFLSPSIVGATLIATRPWTGGVLVMGNAALLLIGAALATPVALPLGIPFLPGLVLMWRGASRAIARRASQDIEAGPQPFLMWAAGGLTPILAFLLIASRLYETCTVVAGSGILECQRDSLGAEPVTFSLIGVAIGLLVAVGLALLALRQGTALLVLAAAVLGLWGAWSPLGRIGLIALALVAISFVLFFLPIPSKGEKA